MNEALFSMNFKVRGIQFTIRGEDVNEFLTNIKEGMEHIKTFFEKDSVDLEELDKINQTFFANLKASKFESAHEKVEQGQSDTVKTCPECGKSMTVKSGKFGSFLACTGYPTCKTTLKI